MFRQTSRTDRQNRLLAGYLAFLGGFVNSFFIGAFLASMMIESNFWGTVSGAYAVALFSEAAILVMFTIASTLTVDAHPRLKDLEAALLCVAMGMQNSLVTRLSGAVVRTTHLTGVITDIGIEG